MSSNRLQRSWGAAPINPCPSDTDQPNQGKSQEELSISRAEQLISLAEKFDKRVSELQGRSQRLLTLLFAAAAFIITPFLILPDNLTTGYVGTFYILIGVIVIGLGRLAGRSIKGMRDEAKLHFERSLFLYFNAFDLLRQGHSEFKAVLTKKKPSKQQPSELATELDDDGGCDIDKFEETFKKKYSFGKSSLYSGFPLVVMLLGVVYFALGASLILAGQSTLPIFDKTVPTEQVGETVDEQETEQSDNSGKVIRRVARALLRQIPI